MYPKDVDKLIYLAMIHYKEIKYEKKQREESMNRDLPYKFDDYLLSDCERPIEPMVDNIMSMVSSMTPNEEYKKNMVPKVYREVSNFTF